MSYNTILILKQSHDVRQETSHIKVAILHLHLQGVHIGQHNTCQLCAPNIGWQCRVLGGANRESKDGS